MLDMVMLMDIIFTEFGTLYLSLSQAMEIILFLVENLEHNDFVALRNMLLRYDFICCYFQQPSTLHFNFHVVIEKCWRAL